MHELPIVQDVIRVVAQQAYEHGIRRVRAITMVVGELSSVVDESMQMYFELLAEGTPCEGAALRFEHVAARLRCRDCGAEFEHLKGFECPRCGGDGLLIKGTGRELYVKSIEGD